ncbi:MAG: Rpn family recombination-promoting nuclease/putative transposase [Prevotella sp.]|nr:Rpn family recombination-promoting nuclease/putative transposase [Prevotella sp.]
METEDRKKYQFINPFTDMGFKKIFGQEITKDLLIDFLNDLLIGEREITDIQFLDKEQLGVTEEDRSLIYDVYCETVTGEKIIVEMQNKSQPFFKDRALYYLSNAIARQGEKGTTWKYEVKAVYGVFFMNFHLEQGVEAMRRDIILANKETHKLFSDKMRFIFLELPSFKKEEEECDNDFERWIYVLKNMETLNRLPFKAQKSVFKKLEQIVDIASMSKADRIKYDESIKKYRDTLAVMSGQWLEGKAEGKAEGLQEGETRGLLKGKAEGIQEVAKNMKAMKMSDKQIAAATGLSEKVIKSL